MPVTTSVYMSDEVAKEISQIAWERRETVSKYLIGLHVESVKKKEKSTSSKGRVKK